MSFTKFLDPKNDFAFKRIFGTEKNKSILIHFLNDMLTFRKPAIITDVSFLKPVQDPEIPFKKMSIVDVLCKDENGNQYIVEMQVAHTKDFIKRAQYYAANVYCKQLGAGEKYQNLKEIIFLAITNFVMFPEKEAYKSDHVILDAISHEHDLKDFSFTFVELPKFNKDIDHLSSMIEKWIYFFKHAQEAHPEDLKKIIGNDEVIHQAYHELNKYFLTEDDFYIYERVCKDQRDEIAMLDAAEERGERKILLKQLQYRFGFIPSHYQKMIAHSDSNILLAWCERIITATSIKEVFCETA